MGLDHMLNIDNVFIEVNFFYMILLSSTQKWLGKEIYNYICWSIQVAYIWMMANWGNCELNHNLFVIK